MLVSTEWSRPDQHVIRSKWIEFFLDPSLSLCHMRKLAFQGHIKSLRSLYWRIFLGQLPGPIYPTNATTKNIDQLKKASWSLNLKRIRFEWEELRSKFLRAPDGLWLEDSRRDYSDHQLKNSSYGNNLFNYHVFNPNPIENLLSDLGVNNPLSQHEANPWNVWLRDLELRQTIEQDVIRTFPELKYFRQPRTQVMLTNILHVYSKIHEDVGYRQGMHEVLGVLLQTLDLDSLNCPIEEKKPTLMHQVLSREFLEHDVFNLFCLLMRPMRNWYDPNLSIPLRDLANRETTPLTSLGFTPQFATASPIESDFSDAGSQLVHPIVEKCASIFHVYLKQLDPGLWAHIDKLEIEPQLWGIRWLRLLFTREFTYRESILLWDGIFAHEDGASLRLVDFISIVMFLRIRGNLLESDYSGALQLILKFPQPADRDSRMDLLLHQAILLSRFPTPSTVVSIIQQNLDLRLYPCHPSISRSNSWFSIGSKTPITSSTALITQNPFISNHQTVPPQASFHPLNLTQAIQHDESQSFIDSGKTQTLAKPRSFLGALAGLRKNYSATLRLDNHSPTESSPTSAAQPQSPSDSKNSNSPISIKQDNRGKRNNSTPQLQQQLQINYLANQEVGQALQLCVDALQQNMLNKLEANQEMTSQDSSQGLALGVLKHIRDVMLSGFSSNFDSNVMSPLMEYQSATSSTHQSYSDKSLEERHSGSSSSSLNHSDPSSPKIDRRSPCQSLSTTREPRDHTFNQEATNSIECSNDISLVSLSPDRSKSLQELIDNDLPKPCTTRKMIRRSISHRQEEERNKEIPKILPLDIRYKFLDPPFLSSPL